MSRGSLRAKPREVTLRDGRCPRARGCFAQANVMVFRKAQERSRRVLVRVGMEDLTKIRDISHHQSPFRARRACRGRSVNADKALLAIDSFGRLTGRACVRITDG